MLSRQVIDVLLKVLVAVPILLADGEHVFVVSRKDSRLHQLIPDALEHGSAQLLRVDLTRLGFSSDGLYMPVFSHAFILELVLQVD